MNEEAKYMYTQNYFLSLSDLMLVEGFAEAYGKQDVEKIEEYLWQNGMDVVEYPYSDRVCQHRNLHNKVVNCLRYDGTERCDPEWIATGAASLEAHINSEKDYSKREEMRKMSRTAEGVGLRGRGE